MATSIGCLNWMCFYVLLCASMQPHLIANALFAEERGLTERPAEALGCELKATSNHAQARAHVEQEPLVTQVVLNEPRLHCGQGAYNALPDLLRLERGMDTQPMAFQPVMTPSG